MTTEATTAKPKRQRKRPALTKEQLLARFESLKEDVKAFSAPRVVQATPDPNTPDITLSNGEQEIVGHVWHHINRAAELAETLQGKA